MRVIRFLFFISTFVVVAKSSAEADNGSVLAQSLSESKHMVRGSGSNDEEETGNKEETSSVNQRPKRMLEAGTKRLLQLIPINIDIGCCDDDDEGDESNDDDKSDDDDESSNPPSMYPSHPPSIVRYEEKKLVASDGRPNDHFGRSCSMANELVVVGANFVDDREGAAYLFHMDGTEVAKLTPGDDGEEDYKFGSSVSIDEEVVVGTYYGEFVKVFSHDGIYERTIRCDDCINSVFGRNVATLGNLIVTKGATGKLLIYSNEDGQLLKSLEQEDSIDAVAISEQFIVLTSWFGGKTLIYKNTSPDFPKIGEINQGGWKVAVAGDRIVIGNWLENNYDGAAWLYESDGTLVKALDRRDASSESYFGWSVAITDDKVLVSAREDDDQGEDAGSVFIYSAVTGEFVEKVLAPDGEAEDEFGSSVCTSDSYFVVGAPGVDDKTGAAYLFQFSQE